MINTRITGSILAFVGFALCQSDTFAANKGEFCPDLGKSGVISLDFQPAFLHIDKYESDNASVFDSDGLTISSFYNAWPNAEYDPSTPGSIPIVLFERDLVARIPNIALKDVSSITAMDVEVVTDQHLPLGNGTAGDGNSLFAADTIWPNEVKKAPKGVFSFEALVVPQGFHTALKGGRLSLINLSEVDDNGHYPEYVIHQSGTDEANPDKFYHSARFVDMNGDSRKDIVTVRSGFRVSGKFSPPSGDLVWFEHPENYDGSQQWVEHQVYQMPFPGTGPDINLAAADLTGDGVDEIVTTHFFTGEPGPENQPAVNGKIVIYGVPDGFSSWSGVGFGPGLVPPKIKSISEDQGFPFDVVIEDLNRDGKPDLLVSNHQPVKEYNETPGRVLAFEQPASGKLFEDSWPMHILKDNIRPYPNLPGRRPPGRLAPGSAEPFQPIYFKNQLKPWILVSGDESGKVWVMKPKNQNPNSWEYKSAVIFDINSEYGDGVSQTPTNEGITISTIGKSAIRYDFLRGGLAEVYIPVFEARDIHVLSFYSGFREQISCLPE